MRESSIAEEFRERIDRFQHLLIEQGIDGALVVHKIDLYYLTGTDQNAVLFVPASDQPLLMVRKSYERAIQDTEIDHIIRLTSLSQMAESMKNHSGKKISRLGLELDILPVNLFLAYQKQFPDSEMLDISTLLRSVRMVKSSYEIACLKKAAEIADRLFEQVPDFLRESETEIDLALRAEAFYRRHGHPGLSRMRGFNMEAVYGHIMAGPSGAVPSASPGPTGGYGPGPYLSQGAGHAKIEPHEPILVDYTSNVEGYISDQSRIFSKGELPEKYYRAHEVMRQVQQAVAQQGKPGAKAKDLYDLASGIVEKAGIFEGFMGYPEPVPFVGHGLGLELDEWPIIGKRSEHVLEKGMIIALEPKFIFPGEGVVGIENTFVVTGKGMEKLNRFPDDIVAVP
ncbi:MAG: Xaa-Pro peptidase family protein [Desulfobacteraceae bacterium]|jgi:Xaa-Pro aminopeptidase